MDRASKQLREVARTALVTFGISPRRMTLVARRHNDVFRVDAEGGPFALRIQNDLLSDPQAMTQLAWLEALARDTTLSVPTPVRTIDSLPFTHVRIGDARRRAVLLRWLPGRPAAKADDDTYRRAAAMIAQLHDHATLFRPARALPCRKLDDEWLFGDRYFVRRVSPFLKLDASQRRVMTKAERSVRDVMDALGHRSRRYGFIHADVNLANILFHRGRASPIDFDEFGIGWYLFDIAELIRTSISPDNLERRKSLVLDAYTRGPPAGRHRDCRVRRLHRGHIHPISELGV